MIAAARLVNVGLRDPLRPGSLSPALRPLILLHVEAADGLAGHGEAAPLEAYDGVSVVQVTAALERHAAVLSTLPEPTDADGVREAICACAAAEPLRQALAAVDLALWDLLGRRAGVGVQELLGRSDPPPVALNATPA